MTIPLATAVAAPEAPTRRHGPFIPASTPHRGHTHAVQFYDDEDFLAAAVADFLADGLRAGEPLVVVATAPHVEAFTFRLKAQGLDVDGARGEGRCVLVDARRCLESFMVGGMPDPERFAAVLGEVFARVRRDGGAKPVRAYGEMVDLLWKDGNAAAALRLEELWNRAARVHDFSLLCAYSMASFDGSAHTEGFEAVCREHSHVVPTERWVQADGEMRLVEVALLQQRARSLQAEVERRRELERHLREALEREQAARAEAERAREAAEAANRAKGEFLAVMSHEFRTPLNAIVGYSDLLELDVQGALGEGQRKFVGHIKHSSRHLMRLISDVLDYAKVESGKAAYAITDVPVDETLRAACALVQPQMQARRITCRLDVCEGPVAARADPERVQQILLNLLSNAVKFTAPGGEVRVECAVESASVRVRVRDNGIGIPPERLEAIFEPFVQIDAGLTRTHEGVGLGLAISRDLARDMGGDLLAESRPGEGSTFTLVLPRSAG